MTKNENPLKFFIHKYFIGLIFSQLLILGTAFCEINNNQCNRFAFEADYLYLQPILENNSIAVPVSNGQHAFNLQPSGPGKSNKFSYSSGYRLGANYRLSLPCWLFENVKLQFTYIPAQNKRTISLASFLESLNPSSSSSILEAERVSKISGVLTSKHFLNYYSGNLSIDFPVFIICPFSLSCQLGLHYVWMDYHHHVRLSTKRNSQFQSGTLREKSHTWGLGPELGFKFIYQMTRLFVLKLDIIGALLIEQSEAHFKMPSLNSSYDHYVGRFDPQKLCKVFPFWETKLRMSHSFSLKSYAVEIELGYDYLSYFCLINRIQFPGNGSGFSADNMLTKVDFQGPYVSVNVSF
ncbi:MAG: Lpg1974 family pore-forming outer membrane protein [Parachlamydiaceae bacterium]|nr:Lpg1974 family pore-forming outer membrane protein [Parachlamydiaceae bacterium]